MQVINYQGITSSISNHFPTTTTQISDQAARIISAAASALTQGKPENLDSYVNIPDKQAGQLMVDLFERANDQELLTCFKAMSAAQRSRLLNSYVDWHYDTHRPLFPAVLGKIVEGTLPAKSQKQLLQLMFSALDDRLVDQVAENLTNQLGSNILYPFMALLDEERVVKQMIAIFMDGNKDTIDKVYNKLIHGIASCIPRKRAKCPLALQHLLNMIQPERLNDPTHWEYRTFILNRYQNGERFDEHAANCIFWAAKTLRPRLIGQYASYPKTLASRLTGALQLEADFTSRCSLIREAFRRLQRYGQVQSLLSALIDYRSPALTYCLCAIDNNDFNLMIASRSQSNSWRTQLIRACFFDDDTHLEEITSTLFDLGRSRELFTNLRFNLKQKFTTHNAQGEYLTQDEVVSMSMAELKDFASGILKYQSFENQTISLGSILTSIPPILLAIGMKNDVYAAFIMQCLRHWSEEQLSVISRLFDLDQLKAALQTDPPLTNDQILCIAHAASPDIVRQFCKEQKTAIDDALMFALWRVPNLNLRTAELLRQTTENNQSLTEVERRRLAVACQEPSRRLSPFVSPALRTFLRALQKRPGPSPAFHRDVDSFIEAADCVEQKLRELKKAPYRQISQDLIEPEQLSLFDILPQELVSILTTQMLKLTRFRDYQQLEEYLQSKAITCEADLKTLGYHKINQTELITARRCILDAMIDTANPQSDYPEKQWNALFYDLDSSVDSFEARAQVFIQTLLLKLKDDQQRDLNSKLERILHLHETDHPLAQNLHALLKRFFDTEFTMVLHRRKEDQ